MARRCCSILDDEFARSTSGPAPVWSAPVLQHLCSYKSNQANHHPLPSGQSPQVQYKTRTLPTEKELFKWWLAISQEKHKLPQWFGLRKSRHTTNPSTVNLRKSKAETLQAVSWRNTSLRKCKGETQASQSGHPKKHKPFKSK